MSEKEGEGKGRGGAVAELSREDLLRYLRQQKKRLKEREEELVLLRSEHGATEGVRSAIGDSADELEAARADAASARRAKEEATRKAEELAVKVESLNEMLGKALEEKDRAEIETRNELAKDMEIKDHLRASFEAAEQRVAELQKELEVVAAENKDLNTKLLQLSNEKKKFETDLEVLRAKAEGLEKEMSKLQPRSDFSSNANTSSLEERIAEMKEREEASSKALDDHDAVARNLGFAQSKGSLVEDVMYELASRHAEKVKRVSDLQTLNKNLENKLQETQKRCSEIGLRFKALGSRFRERKMETQKETQKLQFKIVNRILDGSIRRRMLGRCFSRWRSAIHEASRSTVDKELNDALSGAKERDNAMRKLEAEKTELKQQLAQIKSLFIEPPTGLELSHVLATVTLKDSLWVAIDGCLRPESHRIVEWVDSDTLQRWLKLERPPKLPEPIQERILKEFEQKIKDAEEQAAWALSEKENLESDLAKVKKKAQMAVRAAKEGAQRQDMENQEVEIKAKTQLENELARVTRLVDAKQEEIEELQASKAELDAALAAARRDLASAEGRRADLDASISQRFTELRAKLSAEYDVSLEQEKDRFEKILEDMKEKAKALEVSLQEMKGQLENKESQCSDLLRERNKMKASMKILREELEEAQLIAKKAMDEQRSTKEVRNVSPSKLSPSPAQVERKRDFIDPKKSEVEEGIESGQKTLEGNGRSSNLSVEHRNSSFGDFSPNDALETASSASALMMKHHSSSLDSLASQSLFVEQLDALHQQHTRERVSLLRESDALQEQVRDLEANEKLLLEQNEALKEQIRDLNRASTRERQLTKNDTSPDNESLTYLKNVVFKYMSAKETSEKATLLPVLSTILQFSPQETTQIKTVLEEQKANPASTFSSLLFGPE